MPVIVGCDGVQPPDPKDANARVVDGTVVSEGGLLVDGALVALGNQVVATGADGAFSFRNVDVSVDGAPFRYAIVVRDGREVVSAFVGLTRRHLVLRTSSRRSIATWSGHITTLFPNEPSIVFVAEGTAVRKIDAMPNGVDLHWVGSYSQALVLHALSYDPMSPDVFKHAIFAATLTPGAPAVWSASFDRIDATPMALLFDRGQPSPSTLEAALDLGGATRASLTSVLAPPGAVVLPRLPNAHVRIAATAAIDENESRFSMAPVDITMPAVKVHFPAVPSLVSPDDGGSETRFKWSSGRGASQLILEPEAPDVPTFVVTTSEEATRVPDLGNLQLPLHAGPWRWSVRHWEDTPGGVDQITCPDFDPSATPSATSAHRRWVSGT